MTTCTVTQYPRDTPYSLVYPGTPEASFPLKEVRSICTRPVLEVNEVTDLLILMFGIKLRQYSASRSVLFHLAKYNSLTIPSLSFTLIPPSTKKFRIYNQYTMTFTQHEQVTRIVTKFINDFHQPLTDNEAKESIKSVFSPDIKWTDHTFHIQREGYAAVLGLRKAFDGCNQPFETQVKVGFDSTSSFRLFSESIHRLTADLQQQLHPTSSGMVAEVVWIGCCKNDIIRPNGALAVKANGRDFVCHACLVIEVDPTINLIIRIDEYYNKAWWDEISENEYHRMRGDSMKS